MIWRCSAEKRINSVFSPLPQLSYAITLVEVQRDSRRDLGQPCCKKIPNLSCHSSCIIICVRLVNFGVPCLGLLFAAHLVADDWVKNSCASFYVHFPSALSLLNYLNLSLRAKARMSIVPQTVSSIYARFRII